MLDHKKLLCCINIIIIIIISQWAARCPLSLSLPPIHARSSISLSFAFYFYLFLNNWKLSNNSIFFNSFHFLLMVLVVFFCWFGIRQNDKLIFHSSFFVYFTFYNLREFKRKMYRKNKQKQKEKKKKMVFV